MRPLYLQACPGMRVEFDDPALKVCVPDKTRQLFPLRRLSRIIVCGFVEWRTDALLACARRGISIVFLERNGDFIGRWQGQPCRQKPCLQDLAELLERNHGADCYQNWLRGMRRLAARSAARRLHFSDWQTADMAALAQWTSNNLQPGWLKVQKILAGVILSAVLQYLSELGYCESDYTAESSDCDLARDLCDLLLVDFLPVLAGWQRRYPVVPEPGVLFNLFEQRSQRLDSLLNSVLRKLYGCLSRCC